MNINCETILSLYTHKNKKILCQIKVSPNKSRKFKNTCRSLTLEQWNTFDKELKKLITTTDDWNSEKCLKFNIKSSIEVKVQKSKISLKHLYICLGAIDEFDGEVGDVEETDYILQCMLDFKLDVLESQEYEPQAKSTPDKLYSPLSYEPYTPSKKKYRSDNIDTVKTPGIDYLEYNEDTYSPKPAFQETESEALLTEKIPSYTPSPIKDTLSSRESNTFSQLDLLDQVIFETGDEIDSREKSKCSLSKFNKRSKTREIKYIPKSQECAVVDVPVYIPTPIEETSQRKVNKTDNEISNRKTRSNTIDESSGLLLEENSKDKNKTKKEHKHKHCYYGNSKIKSRSKTIDEIPAGFCSDIEKLKSTKLAEECKEKPYKKLKSVDKSTSNKSKDKKNYLIPNLSSTKENHKQSEKKPEIKIRASSSSEADDESSITKVKASGDDFEDDNKIDKNTILSQTSDNASNFIVSATDTSPQRVKSGGTKKENPIDDNKLLRRSERSPSKPLRFIEEQHELLKSTRKPKTSPKNKELFGTDDDDDEGIIENNNNTDTKNDKKVKSSIFETTLTKKSAKSTSSSSKKKRKRDKSSECEQEKRDMDVWLGKKKTASSDEYSKQASTSKSSSSKIRPLPTSKKEKNDTERRQKSETPPFELPSKEELEMIRNKTKLMQQENAKFRAELDKMRTSPPKEVEILSLQDVPLEDILNTFTIYKSELDEIYENNRKRDYIKGHDGINHCFVIRLLPQNIQMKMLEKLTDVYSNNSATNATLFANALLPEWLIRVYMEKFNFTRQQAIKQIKAQEEFKLHMEEQSDNSFMFD